MIELVINPDKTMKLIKNFEEFFDESFRTEELPGVVGVVETDNNIQLSKKGGFK
ncbi:MAG: hypothetical protein LBF05_02970 [Tannerella sp.]|jgi:hypothetical protein|nr:hypothetical protein [Tannerella sp.]